MGKTQFKNKETKKKKSNSIDGINSALLSLQGMYMIRFHSFYPWHSHSNYMNLCNDKDLQMLPWVQEFKLASLSLSLKYTACLSIATSSPTLHPPPFHSKFDLYTKTTELPDIEKLKPYYQSLIDEYCPGVLKFWKSPRGNIPSVHVSRLRVRFNGFHHWAQHCIISSPLKIEISIKPA